MSKTSTLPPSLDTDDALTPKINASALDFLLIELVPLAQRITERLQAREQALLHEYRRSKIFNHPTAASGEEGEDGDAGVTDDGTAKKEMTSLGFPSADEETREAVFQRLDSLGYRVGQGLVERFSTNKPRPQQPLDTIKFICKDLWPLLWRKQIDNLKTNHRGVYVLSDQRFQPLSRMSVDRHAASKAGGEGEAVERAMMYLYFPSGVIRGALAGLGIEASVTGETGEIPTATFQIKTKGAKA